MNRLLLPLVAICAAFPVLAQTVASDVVQSYISAYNTHDVDKMQTLVTDDVRWMSINNDKVTLESSGKKELAESMQSYFEGLPSTRARLTGVRSLGDFVTVIEESGWESKGKMSSQCAVSVYELKEGLILNVWYFAARPCDSPAAQ
jgi:hypothetical protein